MPVGFCVLCKNTVIFIRNVLSRLCRRGIIQLKIFSKIKFWFKLKYDTFEKCTVKLYAILNFYKQQY